MNKVDLRTERLVLSAPALDDVEEIVDVCQDLELQCRVPIPVPYDRQQGESYVTEFSDHCWAKSSACTWAIRLDSKFAGVVSLDHIDAGPAQMSSRPAEGSSNGDDLDRSAGRQVGVLGA